MGEDASGLNGRARHSGHRARMRERFAKQGLDGFADHEVLELLLFYAIPQRDVNPLAHTLLEHFGSFHAVLDADQAELCRTEGVGEYAATLIKLFAAVSARLAQSRAGRREKLRNRREAQAHCIRLLEGLKQEHLYAVCLNGQMEVIADALIAKGSLSEVPAYPRLLAEAALRHNAHSVVLCHNHPGGTAVPSQSDMDMTVAIGELMQRIEVVLIDHIIVADGQSFSMAGSRLIQQEIDGYAVITKVANSAGEVRIPDQLRHSGVNQP